MAISLSWDSLPWISWSVFTLLQVILVFFLYNPDGLKALFYLGWIILTFGFLIGSMGVSTLKKMGGVPKEKTSSRFGVGTTTMVDSGVYSIVRHPQYLCWMFFSLAIILIAQHWWILIIGIAAMVTIYLQARQDEESFIERFGDQYKGGSTRLQELEEKMLLHVQQFHLLGYHFLQEVKEKGIYGN